jgi:hypothetical protein
MTKGSWSGWAWRKGQQHFGTILVDLEQRRVTSAMTQRRKATASMFI